MRWVLVVGFWLSACLPVPPARIAVGAGEVLAPPAARQSPKLLAGRLSLSPLQLVPSLQETPWDIALGIVGDTSLGGTGAFTELSARLPHRFGEQRARASFSIMPEIWWWRREVLGYGAAAMVRYDLAWFANGPWGTMSESLKDGKTVCNVMGGLAYGAGAVGVFVEMAYRKLRADPHVTLLGGIAIDLPAALVTGTDIDGSCPRIETTH